MVEAARAELGVADRALRDASVRAPFAGWIARRDVSRGEYVRPGQPLFELVALDPIEVEFSVAERDSARVHIGQQVGVKVAPYPEEAFQGEVTVISPTLDPKTRTLRVQAQHRERGRAGCARACSRAPTSASRAARARCSCPRRRCCSARTARSCSW